MPRIGPNYNLPTSSDYPAINGTPIDPDNHNATLEDMANALTQSVSRDGAGTMTGDLNMGNRKVTSMAAGSVNTDAVRYDQVTLVSVVIEAFFALAFAAGTFPYSTGATSFALAASTSFGRSLLNLANAAAARTALEATTVGNALFTAVDEAAGRLALALGTMATQAASGVAITGGTVTARLAYIVATGTLSAANANKYNGMGGDITLPAATFTTADMIVFDAGSVSRTVTAGGGVTMLVNGSIAASATLPANTIGGMGVREDGALTLTGAFF